VASVPRRLLLLVAIAALAAVAWTPPALASSSGVVVSELRFRGPAGASDEFVELVNGGPVAVDVSGWRLQGCSATTGTASARVTIPAGTTLAPGRHLLFANVNGFSGAVAADLTYATGIADGGGVRILAADGGYVDGAASSATATSDCREGAGLTLPTTDSTTSLERKGGTQDTGDNAADFEATESDPQNAATVAPSLSVDDVVVSEEGTAVFTVTLSAASARAVTAGYGTADGTAVAPDDYAAVSGVIAFAPGATGATISVPIVTDAIDEPDETFALELFGVTRATIGDGVAQARIVDDDEPPPPPPPGAGDPGVVWGAGTLAGGRFAAFAVRVSLALGASEPRGHLVYVEPFFGLVFVARRFTTLRIARDGATVSGRGRIGNALVDFRLELVDAAGADSFALVWPGHQRSARVRTGRIEIRAG
jgi:hypothetical protein